MVRDPVSQQMKAFYRIGDVPATLRAQAGKGVSQRGYPQRVLVPAVQQVPPEAKTQLCDNALRNDAPSLTPNPPFGLRDVLAAMLSENPARVVVPLPLPRVC